VTTGPPPERAEQASGTLQRLEDGLLALLLGALIVLAALQILLRGVFGTGLAWADPLLRALVLWLGLLGAVAASRDGRHITVDAVSRLLPGRMRAAVTVATSLFAAAVSALIAWHAGRFVASEFAFGSSAFSGIPAWALQSIIPVAFGAIALRYGRLAFDELRAARHESAEGGEGAAG
jgi:TRAP-type C4-dicarboxylate transport system permease small subunit